MRRWHLPVLVAVLTVTAVSLIVYKVRALGYPMTPAEEIQSWIIEARLSFEATGGAAKAELAIPLDPPGYSILDENFVSRGYGLQTERRSNNRVAIWSTRRPSGRQALYYRTTVTPHESKSLEQAVPALAAPPLYDELHSAAVNAILDEVRSKSADIATFSSLLMQMLARPTPDENAQLLLPRQASREDRVRTAIYVLAGAHIPARMARGLRLVDGARSAQVEAWIEVNNGQRWIPIDPDTGAHGYPPDFVMWWRGDTPLFSVERGRDAEVRFSVTRTMEEALETATRQAQLSESAVASYSLLALPVHTQNVYRSLLLIPVGALLIVFLRNVVGVQTFGTFMPVLIALAFRQTDLVAGVLLFSVLVTLGLAVRFYLEHLKLLLVPRLAAVVIIVILLMAFVSILSQRLRFEVGLSVALFPMVILAMTIERMSIVWEEHGPADAIKQGVGSLIVAAGCYLIMFDLRVEHFIFVFPESLLLVLALALLLGRYTGYRVTELLRFRALSEAIKK
ncbi:inactive transglutaminase family protein [Sinimarinibacterium flocculans]|uniref:inactive transglutaminase family protein n=1 Tax=Sinimarinibacterium flocculans TaxID=985250 RepID=UPI0035161C33